MAVKESFELPRSGGIDGEGYRHYRRTFLVTTDDLLDGVYAVTGFINIPLYSKLDYGTGNPENDLYARCKAIDATPVSGQTKVWSVTYDYDSKPFAGNTGTVGGLQPSTTQEPVPKNTQAPADRPWSIKFSTVDIEKVLEYDYNDPQKRIVNSAGQQFEGLTVSRAIPVMTITAYSLDPQFYKVGYYTDTVNDAAFLDYDENQLRCTEYSITSQYEQGIWVFEKQVTIQILLPNANIRVLDAGLFEIKNNKLARITDAGGSPVSSPYPLNGAGAKQAIGGPLAYLPFRGYQKRNFSQIL